MCLHLQELGIPFTPVFLDTGWENSTTYQYLREYLPTVIGEITWLTPEIKLSDERLAIAEKFERRLGHQSAMVRLILYKGMFPSRVIRFCTQSLKSFVIRDYLNQSTTEPINALGIRASESQARANLPEWEFEDRYDCDIWRPLIRWSEDDVIAIHTRHGVRPNGNYLSGAKRVGCWPCIYASKKELHHMAINDPKRVQLVADLETEIAKISGEFRGWFQSPIRADRNTERKSWPIAKVIEWAKTSRGGRQYELFLPPQREQGCMRWGLCDMAPTETTKQGNNDDDST